MDLTGLKFFIFSFANINERQVDDTTYANFKVGLLSHRTWEERHDVALIEQGWKPGHCDKYIYVFDLYKCVGLDLWGFPCRR